MRQVFCVCSPADGANPTSSGTRFFLPVQTWPVDATEANISAPWVVAGSFENLVIVTPTDPGGVAGWDYILRKNGGDTAVAAQILAGTVTGRDDTNSATFAVGDLLSMEVSPIGTPSTTGTTGEIRLNLEFVSTNVGESGYCGAPRNLNTTTTVHNGVFAPYNWNATASLVENVVAAAGSIKYADFRLSGSPGAGKSYVFAIYKNGVKQDGTGGTVDTRITIADAATSGTWSGTLTVAPGDRVYWECVPSGTPTLRTAAFGVRFLATTNGESQVCAVNTTNLNTVNPIYTSPHSRDDDWDTTEASSDLSGGVTSFELRDLYVRLSGDPGAGNSYTFSIRRNTASPVGTLSVAITDAATTGNDTTNAVTITDGDLFTLRSVPASGPTTRQAAWGMVQTDLGALPPTANNDAYSTPYGTLLTVPAASGVLANDTQNGGGGTLTAALDTDVSNGTLNLASDGSFTYLPDFGFLGSDSFTYHAVDAGGNSNIATVTITVQVAAFNNADAIIEMCFGGSFRKWLLDYPALNHWWLGDVGHTRARDDIPLVDQFEASATDGTYTNIPTKGLGLIPEYGLATTFNGVNDSVDIEPTLSGTGGTFTLLALIRPTAQSPADAMAIVHTGSGAGYLGLTSANKAVFGVNGGTLITSAGDIVDGDGYLLVGSYNGSTGRLFVVPLDEDQSIEEVGPTSLTFSGAHNGTQAEIGINATNDPFAGQIQGVAVLGAALALADVQELRAATVWIDVTEDVHPPLVWDRGIHDDNPTSRLARTGTCTFKMDNSTRNTAGLLGYYTPGHANARAGFDRGTPVRVSVLWEDTGMVKFIGTVETLKIDAGEYLARNVQVMALDWMHEAAKASIAGIPVQQDVRADEVIALLVDGMANRPHNLSLGTGTDTYIVALHNIQDERATVQSELQRNANSEQGFIFVKGDGTLRFEPRSVRRSSTTVDHTLDRILATDAERSGAQVYNRIKGTVHPVRIDETDDTLLYHNFNLSVSPPEANPLSIDHGVDMQIFLPFRDPQEQATRVSALTVQTPVANVDLFINSAIDGSGVDLTNDPTVVYEFVFDGGNGTYLNIRNDWGMRIYLAVRLFGQGIYDYETITVISQDQESIRRDGLRELTIDFPYLSNPSTAQSIVNYLREASIASPTRLRSLTYKIAGDEANTLIAMQADISSRLAIEEVMSAVDRTFFVNAERGTYHDSENIDLEYWLAASLIDGAEGGAEVWVLGTSELGINTRLGA